MWERKAISLWRSSRFAMLKCSWSENSDIDITICQNCPFDQTLFPWHTEGKLNKSGTECRLISLFHNYRFPHKKSFVFVPAKFPHFYSSFCLSSPSSDFFHVSPRIIFPSNYDCNHRYVQKLNPWWSAAIAVVNFRNPITSQLLFPLPLPLISEILCP
jgi:hypothetical protein